MSAKAKKQPVSLPQSDLYEIVMPEFFDADALKVPQQTTYRIDNQGERLYARQVGDELKIVPSVTKILRKLPTNHHLIKWYSDMGYEEAQAYVKRRANYGTYMHIMFKQLLLGESLVFHSDLMIQGFKAFLLEQGVEFEGYDFKQIAADLKQDMFGFIRWVNDYKVKPLAIEYIVFGEKYAGAADLICKLTITKEVKTETFQDERMFAFLPSSEKATQEREVIALIDFKSGRKGFHDDNKLQLKALADLWNAERPEHTIEFMANLGMKHYRLPCKEPYDFKEHKASRNKELFAKWPLLVDMYHTDPIVVKDRPDFVDGGLVSLKSTEAHLVTYRNPLADLQARLADI